MAKTTNYNLNKPAQTDFYDVDIFNENADIVDTALKNTSDTASSAKAVTDKLAAVATSGSYEDLTNKPNTGKGAVIYTITADTFPDNSAINGSPYAEIHYCGGRIIYVCPYNSNDKVNAENCSLAVYMHSAAQGELGITVSSTDSIPTDGIDLVVVDLGAFTETSTKKSVVIDGIS